VQRAGHGIRVEAVIVPVAAIVRVHPATPVEVVAAGPAEEHVVPCSAHTLIVALAEAQGVGDGVSLDDIAIAGAATSRMATRMSVPSPVACPVARSTFTAPGELS
jgi:hypothetical protein